MLAWLSPIMCTLQIIAMCDLNPAAKGTLASPSAATRLKVRTDGVAWGWEKVVACMGSMRLL